MIPVAMSSGISTSQMISSCAASKELSTHALTGAFSQPPGLGEGVLWLWMLNQQFPLTTDPGSALPMSWPVTAERLPSMTKRLAGLCPRLSSVMGALSICRVWEPERFAASLARCLAGCLVHSQLDEFITPHIFLLPLQRKPFPNILIF